METIICLLLLCGPAFSVENPYAVIPARPPLEELVVKYGVEKDYQKIRDIIFCESSNNQWAVNENVNKAGIVTSRDWGFMQVNDKYWREALAKRGLDIENVNESLEGGVYLYSKYGDKLWIHSRPCWTSDKPTQYWKNKNAGL